jgi:hypothetical protein
MSVRISPGRRLSIRAASAILLAAAGLVLAEGLIRVVLFWDRVPDIGQRCALCFAAPDEDEFWRLQTSWGRARLGPRQRVNPLFGWSQAAAAPDNPLGLRAEPLAAARARGRKLLFAGDSFVAGSSGEGCTIPECLDRLSPGRTTIDLGVGGFGLDQIVLMSEAARARIPAEGVVIGVYLGDVDRVALTQRTYQKPYFMEDGAGPALRGLPIEPDVESFRRASRPRTRSWTSAFLRRLAALPWSLDREGTASPAKERLTRFLLARLVEDARHDRLPPLFVIFYDEASLRSNEWEEALLKSALAELGQRPLDTKALLLAQGEPLSRFYAPDGHHNAAGNELIAEAVREREARRVREAPALAGPLSSR